MAYTIKQTPLFDGKPNDKLSRWFSGEKHTGIISFNADIKERAILSLKEDCERIINAVTPLSNHHYTYSIIEI